MENANVRAVLKFEGDASLHVRFMVPRAYLGLTPEAARAGMEAIIDTGAVLATNGSPAGIHSAKLVKTQREVII